MSETDQIDSTQEMEKLIDAEEEGVELLQKFADKNDVIMLALIGSYLPRRYNPATSASATISIRDEFGIEKILGEIEEKVPDYKNKKMFMLVNSAGGSLSSAYKTARAIRDAFKDITVFVPHAALSGGTMLALTGNRIRMGLMSQLSPLDIQLYYNAGEQSVSVNSLFKAQTTLNGIFKTSRPDELPYPYKYLAESLDPIIIEEWTGIKSEGDIYLKEILKKSNYKNIDELTKKLTLRFPTHGFVIHYDHAKEIGLKVEKSSENKEVWQLMRNWLLLYIGQQTDRHFIRYVVPKKKTVK